jgi:hypothetical protein
MDGGEPGQAARATNLPGVGSVKRASDRRPLEVTVRSAPARKTEHEIYRR